jgi:hypothetical protein
MNFQPPRIFGRSRNPAGSLATGTIYKRAPEQAVEKAEREPRRHESDEPAEPEAQAEGQTEERGRR